METTPSELLGFLFYYNHIWSSSHKYLFFRHLTKLFDSMAHLTFKDSKNKSHEVRDIALGMIAKDGEVVDFHTECECRGPVSFPKKLQLK